MILKGFAIYEEAAVVVEVECVGISVWGVLQSGWADLLGLAGLSGWRNRLRKAGCGNGMGLVGGWYGGV